MWKYIIGVFAFVQLYACTSDNSLDEQAPRLESIQLNVPITSGDVCGTRSDRRVVVQTGQTLLIDWQVSDDTELSQLKVDIHHNFDCHGHGRNGQAWSIIELIDLEGAQQTGQLRLEVPQNASAGNYHFGILLLDAAGNQSEIPVQYDLVLENSTDVTAPTLLVQTPTDSQKEIQRGDTLHFSGQVADNLPLAGGKITFSYITPQGNRSLLHSLAFDSQTGAQSSFTWHYPVPATLPKGTYTFEVKAFDAVNNNSISTRTITVK